MAETGQVRILRDPKRATHLYQTVSVTLITPFPSARTIPQKSYYQTRLESVPLSHLLDPSVHIQNLVGHTLTPLTDISASLLPNSLHISLPKQSFYTLGLPASRRHAPPQAIPPSRRPFVPVCLDFPLGGKSLARANWALSAERFGKFDILLSAGSVRIEPSVDVHATETEVRWTSSVGRADIPTLGNDEEIWETVESFQAIGTVMERGVVEAHVLEYKGLSNGELVEDCVKVARKVAGEHGWAAVFARAPSASIVWRNGLSRGGFAEGFGGDAAEVFLCNRNKAVSVQLRTSLDVS